jgi:ribosome-associated protein
VIQPANNKAAEKTTSEMLLARILTSLNNDKAEDIVQIDLRGKSSIGDYMIIASGRSSRQVSAISEKLVDNIKQDFGRSSKVEGKGAGDWVLIDAGDIIRKNVATSQRINQKVLYENFNKRCWAASKFTRKRTDR